MLRQVFPQKDLLSCHYSQGCLRHILICLLPFAEIDHFMTDLARHPDQIFLLLESSVVNGTPTVFGFFGTIVRDQTCLSILVNYCDLIAIREISLMTRS